MFGEMVGYVKDDVYVLRMYLPHSINNPLLSHLANRGCRAANENAMTRFSTHDGQKEFVLPILAAPPKGSWNEPTLGPGVTSSCEALSVRAPSTLLELGAQRRGVSLGR